MTKYMTFRKKLSSASKKNNSLLCVGLDTDAKKISGSQFEFNKKIIDATNDLVCVYKPNTAFYESLGAEGIENLKQSIDYIKNTYPEIPVILVAKRGDKGNTNEGYIEFAFNYLKADAITLHPYMGKRSLDPFLKMEEKTFFILCRTSNEGAGEFQNLLVNSKPLYELVAQHVKDEWNYNGNCGLVVGATYPKELKRIREIAPDLPFLIPGIGAQGGDVEKTVSAGIDTNGENAIINSSRSIIFAQNPREEAEKLKKLINSYRKI